MAHNIYRLANTILNTPQLITEQAFAPIAQYLTDRLYNPSLMVTDPKFEAKEDDNDDLIILGNVGVVQIEGSLTYKPVYSWCGEIGSSYLGLIDNVERLVDAGVSTIVFEVNSGGGEAAHLWDSLQTVRDILDDKKVKSVAYVDSYAASAAFAWAVIADEVIVHPSASVGSVGCVVCLTDRSKAMEMEGYKPVFIVSTKGKVPFNEDGSFSESFLTKLQEDVDRLGGEFVGHVEKYTGLPAETVAATDAQMFHAEKAVELGFANNVMTHREFNNYISTII